MTNWTRKCLSEISDSCLGKMLDKNKNKGEYQPYLANQNVQWGEFKLGTLQNMRFEDCEEDRYGLKYGDLIICEGGEPGRCAIWRDELPNMKLQKALHRLRVHDGYSSDFLYYRMLLAGKNRELDRHFIGSTIRHLTGVGLKDVEFEFPSFNDQVSIAKVLRSLDEKIELNNKINDELEAMAKFIYDYWFVQFDFPDANGKPYKSSGGKMVYNEELKREIPEGWKDKELLDIANITMGQSPSGTSYNDDGVGTIFFQGSTDFGYRFPSVRQYTSEPSRLAKKGDILLSVRAPVGTLNIADNDCCIGRGLAALNSKDGADSFLFYVMLYFKQIFDFRNSAGTTFGSITKDDLFSLKVVYPTSNVIRRYDNAVKDFNVKILNNHEQNKQFIQLRDWLLPMLMNGQVRVKS